MSWFLNRTIRFKILSVFALALVAALALNYLTYRDKQQMNQYTKNITTNWMPSIIAITSMQSSMAIGRVAAVRLMYADSNERAFFIRRADTLRTEYARQEIEYVALLTLGWETEKYQELKRHTDEYYNDVKKAEDLLMAGQVDAAKDMMLNVARRQYDVIRVLVHELVEFNTKGGNKEAELSDEFFERSMRHSFIGIALNGVFIVLLAIVIARLISNPVEELEQAAREVIKGDLNAHVQVRSNDEVGKLGVSFNQMVETIRRASENAKEKTIIAEQASKQAVKAQAAAEEQGEYLSRSVETIMQEMSLFSGGDLTAHVEAERSGDDVATLFHGFNSSVEQMNKVVRQILDNTERVNTGTKHISNATMQLAATAEEQSSQTSQLAAAVEEMAQTVAENAQNALRTSNVAEENRRQALQSGEVLQRTLGTMRDIGDAIQQSAAVIMRLGNSSQEIGDVVQVITEIADQTNLLALNAAIEAARAGESGRGFAVVADEVRKLAERTAEATKQISSMIQTLQHDSEAAVQSIRRSSSQGDAAIELANQAGNALQQIIRGTQEVQTMVRQIADASEQQSGSTEEIAKSIDAMSQSAQSTAETSSGIARASEQLDNLMADLRQLLGLFRVEQTDTLSKSYRLPRL
ncbi:MAG: methyl-accepting chemotaxis protein [Candidatus Kapaibacterium sp.]|nr:MAG: methyl-accepting chemotaxis protein [Candidatus Kapabacteria bacterium]